MGDDIIRASEIGQYAYCARAWWLARVRGVSPANVAEMKAGTEHHRRRAHSVQRLRRARWIVVMLFLVAAALACSWLVLEFAR